MIAREDRDSHNRQGNTHDQNTNNRTIVFLGDKGNFHLCRISNLINTGREPSCNAADLSRIFDWRDVRRTSALELARFATNNRFTIVWRFAKWNASRGGCVELPLTQGMAHCAQSLLWSDRRG